jgi:heterodisulfide reductase subunit A-like polyferredoxin
VKSDFSAYIFECDPKQRLSQTTIFPAEVQCSALSASDMEREQDTGISILVVGGGIAGLTFAIEAHRKGHNVRVIERRPCGETFGKYRKNKQGDAVNFPLYRRRTTKI